MSAFDSVIGYQSIKNEMLQICDMIHHRDIYEEMGAKLPRGMLLAGAPGIGKTLMSNAFIAESGLPAFTLRKNKNKAEFIASVTEVFDKAKKVMPSIVFLDDMDKFENEDDRHRDAAAYVAVQAGIDGVAGLDVFVIATVNNMEKLPDSLVRPGRFDRVIEVEPLNMEDAEKVIAYYLSGKKIGPDIDMNDFCKMVGYSSCAELETILNEAAVFAAYKRKEAIGMSDLVNAVMHMQYHAADKDYVASDDDETKRLALHEAGHLVCCEVLCPGGVGFASIRPSAHGGRGGMVHRCKEIPDRSHIILISLASKAAEELYYADHVAAGCRKDIFMAYDTIRNGMAESATMGFGVVDVSNRRFEKSSESMNARNEAVTQALLEQYLMQARDILIQNRAFLELAADELRKKGILLYSDIQRIKNTVGIKAA